MTTTPNLDALAHREDVRNAYRFGYHHARVDVERAEAERPPFRFPTCPEWCNDHSLTVGSDLEGSETAHRHSIRGDGWSVELVEDQAEDRAAPIVFVPMDYREPLSPEQARAYAVALLAACDLVEGRASAS